MQLVAYANWVHGQVNQQPPPQFTRNWGLAWDATFTAMRAGGAYEHAALIVAKWEFLGALYQGSAEDTDVKDARAYADKFLPQYAPLHNLSGACPPGDSEFFSVYRNKCLHGFTPAGVYRFPAAGGDVFGWSLGLHSATAHRQVTAALDVQVDSAGLQAELFQSIIDYADYLLANVDATFPVSPQERWKKGFWGRFRPVHYPRNVWEQEGRIRGLFP
jgi:hypothetical protein